MKRTSSLFRYLKAYERAPHSKAFIPLAEAYRRLGMHKEALELLKKGIRLYPKEDSAQVVLAHVYYDMQKYQLTYDALSCLVPKRPRHYAMNKLYAYASLQLGLQCEALVILKSLLPLQPWDKEIRSMIEQLESKKSKESPKESQGSNEIGQMSLEKKSEVPIESWVQVDFTDREECVEKTLIPSGEERFLLDSEPIATHTLVDLYEKQGMIHRAAGVLERIVEFNPDDYSSKIKLDDLKRKTEPLLQKHHNDSLSYYDQRNLLNLWNEKFFNKKKEMNFAQVEQAFLAFFNAVSNKAGQRNPLNH